jgi:hypothetical protein
MRPYEGVKITLDRERTLRYDFNAMCLIEERTGINLLNEDLGRHLSAKVLRIALWAMLLHEDPSLTLEQVGTMLHPGSMDAVNAAIPQAVLFALPEGEAPEGDGAKNGSLPTG